MTDDELAALYPEGRHLYFEGSMKDLPKFEAHMRRLGIDVHVNITVDVPAEHLKTVYDNWPMGS